MKKLRYYQLIALLLCAGCKREEGVIVITLTAEGAIKSVENGAKDKVVIVRDRGWWTHQRPVELFPTGSIYVTVLVTNIPLPRTYGRP